VVPISVPGIAAAAIVVFIWVWNEFLIGLVMTTGPGAEPIAPSMYNFITDGGIEWGQITAGASIAIVPVVVLFIALQRRFVQGLTAGIGK
jgi:ABC-type glycerol-3-phosphate transport system permease component